MTIFIAGSIKIKELAPKVLARLDSLITKGYEVVLGDADGVDLAVQQHLNQSGYSQVTVYSINQPRNNAGNWPVEAIPIKKERIGRRECMKKDHTMAEEADYGFMIWDCRSPGTVNNILNLLNLGKQSLVYGNPEDEFRTVRSIDDFDHLLSLMSAKDVTAMEKRIGLSKKRADVASRANTETGQKAIFVSEGQLDLFPGDASE